jgi:hypothetical protein
MKGLELNVEIQRAIMIEGVMLSVVLMSGSGVPYSISSFFQAASIAMLP